MKRKDGQEQKVAVKRQRLESKSAERLAPPWAAFTPLYPDMVQLVVDYLAPLAGDVKDQGKMVMERIVSSYCDWCWKEGLYYPVYRYLREGRRCPCWLLESVTCYTDEEVSAEDSDTD